MNQQREVIYDLRTFALEGGEDLTGETWDMIEKTLDRLVEEHAPEGEHPEDWELAELRNRLLLDFFLTAERLPQEGGRNEFPSVDELHEYLVELSRGKFEAQLRQFGTHSEALLRYIVLSTIDERWKDHLYDLDHLKASIGFRGWGQKDPLIEYKREAYEMFVDLLTDIQSSISRLLFRARLEAGPPPPLPPPPLAIGPDSGQASSPSGDRVAGPAQRPAEVTAALALGVSPGSAVRAPRPEQLTTNRDPEGPKQPVAVAEEVGRNDPCPCGSGKKYKKCHGR
jgi:preprotein translocase subunit SecA